MSIIHKYNSMGIKSDYKGFISYSFCNDGTFSPNSTIEAVLDVSLNVKFTGKYKGPITVICGTISKDAMILGVSSENADYPVSFPIVRDVGRYIKTPLNETIEVPETDEDDKNDCNYSQMSTITLEI